MSNDPQKRTSIRRRMGIALSIIVLAVLALAISQIDDWSRDLTTNVAVTSDEADDPLMRSLRVDATPEEVEEAIRKFIESHERWSYRKTDAQAPGWKSIALKRSTKWLRFTDDVEVEVTYFPEEPTLIEITSQSRVGKGDFGQNPRNIRELNAALRETLK